MTIDYGATLTNSVVERDGHGAATAQCDENQALIGVAQKVFNDQDVGRIVEFRCANTNKHAVNCSDLTLASGASEDGSEDWAPGYLKRRSMLNCTWLAEIGAYKSTDKYFKLLMSGPDWVSCSAQAIAQYNSPELRDKAGCVADQYNQRNDCLESTACGSQERSDCDAISLPCAGIDPMMTLIISQQRPDTTILARL